MFTHPPQERAYPIPSYVHYEACCLHRPKKVHSDLSFRESCTESSLVARKRVHPTLPSSQHGCFSAFSPKLFQHCTYACRPQDHPIRMSGRQAIAEQHDFPQCPILDTTQICVRAHTHPDIDFFCPDATPLPRNLPKCVVRCILCFPVCALPYVLMQPTLSDDPARPRVKTKSKKQYVTGDSQEITHPSTSPAQTGLSCEF
jgi:hypothetical protein